MTAVSLERAIAGPSILVSSQTLVQESSRSNVFLANFKRSHDERVKGQYSYFVQTSRSKSSLALDLKQAKGLEALKQIIAKADVSSAYVL